MSVMTCGICIRLEMKIIERSDLREGLIAKLRAHLAHDHKMTGPEIFVIMQVVHDMAAEGDVAKGRRLYAKECAPCHGKQGGGDDKDGVPMLAGQYTSYLWRQVDKLLEKQRIHDPEAPDQELLAEFSREDIRDILAYLSTADD